jgi:hypothetical protein
MRLTDVHLKSVFGATSHAPLRTGPPGFQLVKVFECALCNDTLEVREEVE